MPEPAAGDAIRWAAFQMRTSACQHFLPTQSPTERAALFSDGQLSDCACRLSQTPSRPMSRVLALGLFGLRQAGLEEEYPSAWPTPPAWHWTSHGHGAFSSQR